MKKFFGAIFAAWAIFTFVITNLVFTPLFAIALYGMKEPRRQRFGFPCYKAWIKCFLILNGIRLKVVGKENFTKGENYVITINHNSNFDPVVSCPFVPSPAKTIGKNSYAKVPIFGILYKLGSVLVDRNNKDSRRESYIEMKKTLSYGHHMCLYPEGTRNKTNEPMIEFKDGAFRLAVETQKKIIPALLFNTRKVYPTNAGFYFWPSKIEYHFLPPIEPGNNVELLKQKVRDTMLDYYLKHNNAQK